MLPIKKIISFTILIVILSCNTSFATVASDFIDESISIEALVINALAEAPSLTLDEIISQIESECTNLAQDKFPITNDFIKKLKKSCNNNEYIESVKKAYAELTGADEQAFTAPRKSSRSYSSISGGGPSSASEQ